MDSQENSRKQRQAEILENLQRLYPGVVSGVITLVQCHNPAYMYMYISAHMHKRVTVLVLCMCVYTCMSVTTLASTWFVYTFQVRYVWLLFRLYLIFNWWIFTFRSKLWCEKANMLMSISLPRPPMALMQQHFT